jgi:hypothetical protein
MVFNTSSMLAAEVPETVGSLVLSSFTPEDAQFDDYMPISFNPFSVDERTSFTTASSRKTLSR